MARRGGLGVWLVVFVVLATFVAEPGGSVRFAGEAFRAVGEFGGSVVTEILATDDTSPVGAAR